MRPKPRLLSQTTTDALLGLGLILAATAAISWGIPAYGHWLVWMDHQLGAWVK